MSSEGGRDRGDAVSTRSGPTGRKPASPLRAAVLLVVAVTVVRLIVAANLPLVEDEAYYWTWSTRLAAGYYDHPPAIAWIIAAGTAVCGKTALGVRGAGILLTGLGSIALLPLAESPLLLAAILGSMPLLALGGLLATPDVPLITGWMFAVAGVGRLLADGKWRWAVLAGLGGGLAMLGKYTGVGFWPLAIAAVGIGTGWRLGARVALALVVVLGVAMPNLLWEQAHDWVSVRFQLHHGLAATTPPGLAGGLEFLGAQLGLASPVLFLAAIAATVTAIRQFRPGRNCRMGAARPRQAPVAVLALLTSAPVLVFFTFAATRSRPEVNWAAPAFVGFALLLAGPLGSAPAPRTTRAAWIGVGVAATLTAMITVHAFHPFLKIPNDPIARLGQGAQMADSVRGWGYTNVWTTRYQEAALLLWYDEGLSVTTVPGADREDQFDLWRGADGFTPQLFVRQYRSGEATVIDDLCTRGGPNLVAEHDDAGAITARWQVYEVTSCP